MGEQDPAGQIINPYAKNEQPGEAANARSLEWASVDTESPPLCTPSVVL